MLDRWYDPILEFIARSWGSIVNALLAFWVLLAALVMAGRGIPDIPEPFRVVTNLAAAALILWKMFVPQIPAEDQEDDDDFWYRPDPPEPPPCDNHFDWSTPPTFRAPAVQEVPKAMSETGHVARLADLVRDPEPRFAADSRSLGDRRRAVVEAPIV